MKEGEKHRIYTNLNPASMFIFSSLLVIVIGFIFQLLAVGVSAFIYKLPVAELLDVEMVEGKALSAMKLVQIIGALGTFIFSSMLLSFLYTRSWFGYFTTREKIFASELILVAAIMILSLPFVNFLSELNLKLEIPFEQVEVYFSRLNDRTESLMLKLLVADQLSSLFINLFMIALIPAVGEELVFRGLIQRHLQEWLRKPHIAIIISSAIFSLVHMQVYSFLPRFFLGLVLGYLFFYGRSLWYPMIGHLVNNGLGVYFYFKLSGMEETENGLIEEIGTPEKMPLAAIISIVAVLFLMMTFIKLKNANQRALSHHS